MSISNGLGKLDNSVAGQLIIKASVGDDIRRIPILNDDLTYDELILMMQRVFRGVLETNEELVLKYKDEDGDLVSLTDTNDLSHAINYSRVLRLTILKQNAANETNSLVDAEVVKELRNIRDKVNHLLDKVVSAKPSAESNKIDEAIEGSLSETVASVANLNLEQNKEFDPLGQEQPIVASTEKTRQASGQSSISTGSAPSQGHGGQPPQPQAASVYPPQPQSAASYPAQATPYPGGPPTSASAQYPGAPAASGYPGAPASSYAPGPPTGTNTYSAPASGPGMPSPAKPAFPGGPPSGPPTASYGYPQSVPQPGSGPTPASGYPQPGSNPTPASGYPQPGSGSAQGYPQSVPQPGSGGYPQSTPNNFPGYPGQQPGAGPMPGQQQGAGPVPGQQPGPYGAPPAGSFSSNPYSRVQPGQGQGYPRPPQ